MKNLLKSVSELWVSINNTKLVEQFSIQKTGADVTIINRGTIRVTEYIKIVEKSSLPKFEKNWEHVLEKKTLRKVILKFDWKNNVIFQNDLQFELTNEGTISIITEIYLFVEDANAFFKEGHLELLSRGCAVRFNCTLKSRSLHYVQNEEIDRLNLYFSGNHQWLSRKIREQSRSMWKLSPKWVEFIWRSSTPCIFSNSSRIRKVIDFQALFR